jgi:hypothetical protein
MRRYRDQDPRQDAYNGDTQMDSPSGGPVATYLIACFGCRQTFDAFPASWCSCLVSRRSLTCPHCENCFCKAYKEFLVDDYLPKPLELRALEQLLRKHLSSAA